MALTGGPWLGQCFMALSQLSHVMEGWGVRIDASLAASASAHRRRCEESSHLAFDTCFRQSGHSVDGSWRKRRLII